MGRPIKKKFFGNTITPYQNHAVGGKTGVGGESVSTITVSNTGTNYSKGTVISFAAPDISGGIRATGHPVFGWGPSGFGISSIVIDNPGSGYQSAPVMTLTKASTVTTTGNSTNTSYILTGLASVAGISIGMLASSPFGMQASSYVASIDNTTSVTLTKTMTATTSSMSITFSDNGASFAKTVNLTSGTQDAIKFNSYLTTGTSTLNTGDILKQEASKRYLVQNAQGKGQCKLVTTSTLTAGTMNIIATDFNGSTYFVKKLTARKAVVVRSTSSGGGFLVTDGHQTGWTLNGATGTVVTISHTI